MAKGLFIGLGAAAALAAAITAGIYGAGEKKVAEPALAAKLEAAAETACIVSNVRLVEGMSRGCLTPAQIEALRDRAVIGGDGAPVDVNLAAPESGGADNVARSCADYDALTEKGWYALTGADMKREEYFARACGALALLADATPAQSSHFIGGKADIADIRSMAEHDAIEFGESAPSVTVDVVAIEAGVWKVLIGAGETMVYELAHADFTGDGIGEILAYVSVGAAGGTARSGSIGLLVKPDEGGPCSFSAR